MKHALTQPMLHAEIASTFGITSFHTTTFSGAWILAVSYYACNKSIALIRAYDSNKSNIVLTSRYNVAQGLGRFARLD